MTYEPGTVIKRKIDQNHIPSPLFHFGIVSGDGKVVHVPGFPHGDITKLFQKAVFPVQKDTLEMFADNQQIFVEFISTTKTKREIASEAENWVGKDWVYHLIMANCESFVNLCAKNSPISGQAEILLILNGESLLNKYKSEMAKNIKVTAFEELTRFIESARNHKS